MSFHKVEIALEGHGHRGRGTVAVDGIPLKVRSLQVNAGVDDVTTVQLEILADEVSFEGQALLERLPFRGELREALYEIGSELRLARGAS